MRVLAVDPGAKCLGIAISDPSGVIANPLTVVRHVSRGVDVQVIVDLAVSHGVRLIIVGQSLDDGGQPTFEGRRAVRLVNALRALTEIPVRLWDEAFTTHDARSAQIRMGVRRKARAGHLDEMAATVLLQSYLDANPHQNCRAGGG